MIKIKKGFTGSTLKIIAIVAMFFDHIGAVMIEPIMEKMLGNGGIFDLSQSMLSKYSLLLTMDGFFRSFGRIAFLLFCFLLVEGFTHTSNKIKYASRLFIFALISEIPFDLAINGKILEFSHQNIFFTLTIALLAIIIYEKIPLLKNNKILFKIGTLLAVFATVFLGFSMISHGVDVFQKQILLKESFTLPLLIKFQLSCFILLVFAIIFYISWKKNKVENISNIFLSIGIISIGFFVAYFSNTDYSGYGVLAITAMYFLRRSKIKSFFIGYLILCFMNFGEIEAILALIPVALYNGKRGLSLKYIFYIFYPLHLLVLYLLMFLF